MTDEKLLDALKEAGILTEEVATRAKREVLVSGRSAESFLNERRLADDIKIAEFKSKALRIPFQRIDFSKLDPSLLSLMPEETVRTYGLAPISKNNEMLVAGMLHPDDVKAQEALRFIAQRYHVNLGVYVISYGDWQEMLKRYSPYKSDIEAVVRSLNLKPGEVSGKKIVRLEEDIARGNEEAPIIRIVSDTFKEAVENRASDVHFEPQESYFRIRMRVDGELREAASLPAEVAQPIISRIKVISNLKIDENRIPQDGRFRARIFDREIDFRVSTFPTPIGEKVAVRVLDPTTGLRTFDQLGLVGKNLALVEEGIQKPYGMILLTGPTGSGKTTTLYALLQALNGEGVNIVSLEDPVEYFVGGVNQSQVRPEIGYDFAAGLRQILRQDPDVIMVGEIRDSETASLAVQAALTGHIVLSTLHTNNAMGVIPRLMDMKVESFLLPVSLNIMISQRLVGLLCDNCKSADDPPAAVTDIMEEALDDLPQGVEKPAKPWKIYHVAGCGVCKGRGVTGRLALFEVLRMTKELQGVVASGMSLAKINTEAKRQGMISLRQDGILKALSGLVSAEEVIRVTEEGD